MKDPLTICIEDLRARKEAREWLESLKQRDGTLYQHGAAGFRVLYPDASGRKISGLNGWFTASQLRALADHMEKNV